MDGENNVQNPIKMDDLGENPLISETPHICYLFFVPALLMQHQRAHKPCAEDQSRKSRKAKSPRPTPRRTWEKRVGLGLFWKFDPWQKIPWEKSHGKIWGETKKEEHQDVSGRTQDFSMDWSDTVEG